MGDGDVVVFGTVRIEDKDISSEVAYGAILKDAK